MPANGRRNAWLVLFLVIAGQAPAQVAEGFEGYIPPEAEAPEAILSLEVGSADVDLFVQGTWSLDLSYGVGLRALPAGGVELTSGASTLANGPQFTQVPSLEISAVLLDKFFLETQVRAAGARESVFLPSELGYLRMGYRATGDELLRSLLLGTQGIEISPYPYLAVPSMGSSSLGVGARIQGPRSTQEIVLRLDRLPGDSVRFVGMNRVTEERILPSGYLRGRRFLLPDRDVRELEVLIQDPRGTVTAGDGRTYRAMGATDGSLSANDGTVALTVAPAGSLLVWYQDAAGRPVGDAELGRGFLPGETSVGGNPTIDPDAPAGDFDWDTVFLDEPLADRAVVVGGRTFLRLWQPGEFSPFELASVYETSLETTGGRIVAEVTRRGSVEPMAGTPPELVFLPDAEGPVFTASLGGEPRAIPRERYPLPDPDHVVYGPFSPPPSSYFESEIRVRVFAPVEYLRVPPPVVPGSIRVVRGGVGDPLFTADYATGRVDLASPVLPGEEIEVFYRSAVGATATDLVVAWGNRIELGEHHLLELAGGLVWNVSSGAYTTRAGEATGGLTGSASLSGSIAPEAGQIGAGPRLDLDYRVAVSASLTQPDTTGTRRLFGMEGDTRALELSAQTARPSALPQGIPGVQADGRGELTYRDYHRYTVGADILQPYDAAGFPPDDQVHTYVDGEITGPYDVAGGADGTGAGLALEFNLDAARGQTWAGMQLPLATATGLADLSGTQTILISYLAEVTAGSWTIWLEAGALAEDLDGDGRMDAEESATGTGFSFDDAANGVSLRVGAGPRGLGNGVRDTEDIDGNGYLDPEEPALSYLIATVSADETAAWSVYSRALSTADVRRLLARSRALRVVAVREGTATAAGRLIVDRIELAGSTFWATPTEVEVTEVREQDLAPGERPGDGATLPEVFPEVEDRFHANGAAQKVLRVAWESLAGESLAVRGFATSSTGGVAYRELRAYLRSASLTAAAQVSLELVDGAGQGIHASFPVTAGDEWREVVADTASGTVNLGGAAVETATVTVDAGALDLVELKLTVTGATGGRIYLDEVRLTAPPAGAGVAGRAEIGLKVTGPLLSVGDTVLVSGVRAGARVSASTAGYGPLFGLPTRVTALRADADAGVDTAVGSVTVRAGADAAPGYVELSGGHDVSLSTPRPIPLRGWVRDVFSMRGADPDYDHHTTAGLSVAWAGVEASATSGVEATGLSQSWRGSLSLQPPGVPSLRLGVEASKRSEGYASEHTGYAGWWVAGYGLLAPWTGGTDRSRVARATGELALPTRPVGFRLAASTGLVTTPLEGSNRVQKTTLGYGLDVPVAFRPGGGPEVTVSAGYHASLDLSASRAEGATDFSEDLAVLAEVLASHGWLLGGVPVVDVLSPSAMVSRRDRLAASNDYPLSGAVWRAELTAGLGRGVGTRLVDLVVPTVLDLTLARRVALAGDLAEATTDASASLRFSALNLFGRRGSTSLFSFYDTDELSAAMTATVSAPLEATPSTPLDVAVVVAHRVALTAGAGTAVLENKLRVAHVEETRLTEEAGAQMSWTHLAGLPVPALVAGLGLSPARARSKGALIHTERLALVLDAPTPAGLGTVSVTLRHETRVAYEEIGFAAIRIGLAVEGGRVDVPGPWTLSAGLEGGLEIELRF